MRWWLALTFALIAAVTAVFVASLLNVRSQAALRQRAEETAAGTALWAAVAIGDTSGDPLLRRVEQLAKERRLALFVYDANGTLVTSARSVGIGFVTASQRGEAAADALDGHRFVSTLPGERATVVGLPLSSGGALVAFVPHPEYGASLGAFRAEIVKAAVLAVGVGAAIGLVIALLIARRLRRIAAAAADIESGRFDRPLRAGFQDELGELAATVDRMRSRLRASFEELEAERDRLGKLLERLHDGVIAVTRDLRVAFANAPAARMTGMSDLQEGDTLPEPWDGFSFAHFVSDLFGRDVLAEEELRTPTGRTYLVTGIPADPEAETVVVVLSDVSERERRERAERDFVTNAAHELRTPLQTIMGAVEVLQGGAKEKPDQRDRFLSHVERESRRLARLVRALLVLARAQTETEAPLLTTTAVKPLLSEVAAGVPLAPAVEMDVDCEEDLIVSADPDLLEQAVFNLAKNAAEHTTEGRIHIGAWKQDDGGVVIVVADTGPGIPPEMQDRIFDRFSRGSARDGEGFGLGLAITEQAVHSLGGRLGLVSSPGRGTRATITMPRSAIEEAA